MLWLRRISILIDLLRLLLLLLLLFGTIIIIEVIVEHFYFLKFNVIFLPIFSLNFWIGLSRSSSKAISKLPKNSVQPSYKIEATSGFTHLSKWILSRLVFTEWMDYIFNSNFKTYLKLQKCHIASRHFESYRVLIR